MATLWLLFFPNAPYIFTDLIHLTSRHGGVCWADLCVVLLFALTGFLLGFVSLYLMQNIVTERMGRMAGWLFTLAVALIGTSLVLLNSGIDELGNPRLRSSRGMEKINGRRVWPTDPTPVLNQLRPERTRLEAFAHSFSRSSLLDETPAGGELR